MREHRLRIMIAMAVTLALVLVGCAGWMLRDAWHAARREAEQTANNLVLSLERDIARNIEIYDLSLNSAASGLNVPELAELRPEVRQATLFDTAVTAANFGPIGVTDAAGDIIYHSWSAQQRPGNFADRGWFRQLKEQPGHGLHISLAVKGLLTGRQMLVLSRRIERSDGSFAGAVAGGIYLDYFDNLFSGLVLGEGDVIALVTEEGQIVARRPYDGRNVGRDISGAEVFRRIREARHGLFENESAVDGVRRVYSYRRVGDLPLVVQVGLATRSVYAEWWSKAVVTCAVLAALAAITVLLAAALWRELERRSRAEAAARESEASFRLLTEHASDMVSRVGPDGARRYVSPASSRLLGLPPEAVLDRRLLESVVAEDRPALDESTAGLLAGVAEQDEVAFRVLHPEHGEIWIEATARGLRDPATGAPDGFVSVMRDVTARRRTEAALAESEARYRLLADSTRDAIICLDLELRRTYASPATRAVYGCDPADMLGGTPADTMHPDDREAAREIFRRVGSGEVEHDRATYRAQHARGHWVWVEVDLGLVRDVDTGKPASLTCAVRDVSERQAHADELRSANAELDRLARHLAQARDRAERASRTKSRFLAGMSHELRTPLNGILGYAELLRLEGDLNALQTQRLHAMLEAGTHLLEMINCVLDLSQIEAGHIELQSQPFAPDALARACLDLLRRPAEEKGLALKLTSALEPALQVVADPMRLRQVLLNLLGNAVKFTARGSVELRMQLLEGPELRIEIADTGVGIPAEHRHRLFQDFDRLAADAAKVEGSGLGLALSAQLAGAMGGSIGHKDNPGGGSVFWLQVPVTNVAAPCGNPDIAGSQPSSAPRTAARTDIVTSAASPLRVLLVDDVAMNRDIASSFLRAASHQVVSAAGGAEAIVAAAAEDFDVIFMDVRMPGMDGLDATRRIRALEGSRGRVPIIALTAQAFSEQVAECRASGMDGHLSKPFTSDALLDAAANAAASGKARAGLQTSSEPSKGNELKPAGGRDLPVLNTAAFASTAAFLSAGAIGSYMTTLIARGEALLGLLSGPDALAREADRLAGAAHTLAGSSGMFGFERLAASARRFERALGLQASDMQALAADLIAALEASLQEMRQAASNATPALEAA